MSWPEPLLSSAMAESPEIPYDPAPPVLFDAESIAARVAALGAEISGRYRGEELVLIGVLKGSFVFMADLVRAIDLPMTCDFLRVSSYGAGTTSSGEVRFEFDTTQPIAGKHVVIVEDIIDTGLTISVLLERLATRGAASLAVAALLHKPARTTREVPIDFLGFEIPDAFVIGYGLDYAGKYRNLPYIGTLSP